MQTANYLHFVDMFFFLNLQPGASLKEAGGEGALSSTAQGVLSVSEFFPQSVFFLACSGWRSGSPVSVALLLSLCCFSQFREGSTGSHGPLLAWPRLPPPSLLFILAGTPDSHSFD